MDAELLELMRSVGIDNETVRAVFERPKSSPTECYTEDGWLCSNSVYGVVLRPGESIGEWVVRNIGMRGEWLSANEFLVATPLPDASLCFANCQTVVCVNTVPAITALISASSAFSSIVCVGPVQALCDESDLSVAQIVEQLVSFCSPRYDSTQELPPVILFNDGDAEDKYDVQIIRQYAFMLKSSV